MPIQPLEELPKEKLKMAIFELVDMWVPTTDAQDFSDFLSELSKRVKYQLNSNASNISVNL